MAGAAVINIKGEGQWEFTTGIPLHPIIDGRALNYSILKIGNRELKVYSRSGPGPANFTGGKVGFNEADEVFFFEGTSSDRHWFYLELPPGDSLFLKEWADQLGEDGQVVYVDADCPTGVFADEEARTFFFYLAPGGNIAIDLDGWDYIIYMDEDGSIRTTVEEFDPALREI